MFKALNTRINLAREYSEMQFTTFVSNSDTSCSLPSFLPFFFCVQYSTCIFYYFSIQTENFFLFKMKSLAVRIQRWLSLAATTNKWILQTKIYSKFQIIFLWYTQKKYENGNETRNKLKNHFLICFTFWFLQKQFSYHVINLTNHKEIEHVYGTNNFNYKESSGSIIINAWTIFCPFA